MLDQSFSPENFQKIIELENRKGVFLEDSIPELKLILRNIKGRRAEFRAKRRTLSPEDYEKYKTEALLKINELEAQRKKTRIEHLSTLSEKISEKNFKIDLKKAGVLHGKVVYTIENDLVNRLALKQLQYNFNRLYKVRQANRFTIVSQVKNLLADDFPKIVIRTDVKEFYESISHDFLRRKLHEDNLLTYTSKKIIFQILSDYRKLASSDKGIPRGVGISAFLAELHMREFDRAVKALPDVTYYARYVDDIIIIYSPAMPQDIGKSVAELDTIFASHGLSRNIAKTEVFDQTKTPQSYFFNYLGYKFRFGLNTNAVSMADKKINKYISKLDLIFFEYLDLSKIDEKKARKDLVLRIRFLTSNTRLSNNKRRVLTGIYYSNSLITGIASLKELDETLTLWLSICNVRIQQRLLGFTFLNGFNSRRFIKFSNDQLTSIQKAWKYKI